VCNVTSVAECVGTGGFGRSLEYYIVLALFSQCCNFFSGDIFFLTDKNSHILLSNTI
jgi:hypothetical protein